MNVTAFTTNDFRAAVGTFATGVTIVTTRGEEHAYGMTANAFSSVSLDPPLVLMCVMSSSEGCSHIRRNGCFAVNILHVSQEPLSRFFASSDRPRGPDAFGGVVHRTAVTGSPILEGTVGYLDCFLRDAHVAGDHEIFIGEAAELGFDPDGQPLVFHGGRYKVLEAP